MKCAADRYQENSPQNELTPELGELTPENSPHREGELTPGVGELTPENLGELTPGVGELTPGPLGELTPGVGELTPEKLNVVKYVLWVDLITFPLYTKSVCLKKAHLPACELSFFTECFHKETCFHVRMKFFL